MKNELRLYIKNLWFIYFVGMLGGPVANLIMAINSEDSPSFDFVNGMLCVNMLYSVIVSLILMIGITGYDFFRYCQNDSIQLYLMMPIKRGQFLSGFISSRVILIFSINIAIYILEVIFLIYEELHVEIGIFLVSTILLILLLFIWGYITILCVSAYFKNQILASIIVIGIGILNFYRLDSGAYIFSIFGVIIEIFRDFDMQIMNHSSSIDYSVLMELNNLLVVSIYTTISVILTNFVFDRIDIRYS